MRRNAQVTLASWSVDSCARRGVGMRRLSCGPPCHVLSGRAVYWLHVSSICRFSPASFRFCPLPAYFVWWPLTPAAHAWEHDGHTMINRLAASTLPADVPAFLQTPAAIDEIEYLGPEPDRWRSPAEPELSRRTGAGALHRSGTCRCTGSAAAQALRFRGQGLRRRPATGEDRAAAVGDR